MACGEYCNASLVQSLCGSHVWVHVKGLMEYPSSMPVCQGGVERAVLQACPTDVSVRTKNARLASWLLACVREKKKRARKTVELDILAKRTKQPPHKPARLLQPTDL